MLPKKFHSKIFVG